MNFKETTVRILVDLHNMFMSPYWTLKSITTTLNQHSKLLTTALFYQFNIQVFFLSSELI